MKGWYNMTEREKIVIEVLIEKAMKLAERSSFDYHIKDITDICYELDCEYTEQLIELHQIYIP